MKILTLLLFLSAIALSGCADPAANKPKAQVSQPSAFPTAENLPELEMATKGTKLTFGPATSTIEFLGSKVTGQHDGGFTRFRGAIDLVDEKPASSHVVVEIEMASVFADVEALTEHLRTGDFFDVAKHPLSTFSSTAIVPDTEKGANHFTVTGDLEMRGVKKALTFPATISVMPDQVQVKAEFSFNRKDFGIVYAGKADDLIRDDVVLILDIRAPRNL